MLWRGLSCHSPLEQVVSTCGRGGEWGAGKGRRRFPATDGQAELGLLEKRVGGDWPSAPGHSPRAPPRVPLSSKVQRKGEGGKGEGCFYSD